VQVIIRFCPGPPPVASVVGAHFQAIVSSLSGHPPLNLQYKTVFVPTSGLNGS
jgi:hypothetical protein